MLGSVCCGGLTLSLWEWFSNKSLVRSVAAASGVLACIVLSLLGAGCAQLHAVGAFSSHLKLPSSGEALRTRLKSELGIGEDGRGGGSLFRFLAAAHDTVSQALETVLLHARDGIATSSPSQGGVRDRNNTPFSLTQRQVRAVSAYARILSKKSSIELIAEGSALANRFV